MKNINKDKNLVKEKGAELNESMLDDVAGGFDFSGIGNVMASVGDFLKEGSDVANELDDAVEAGKKAANDIKNIIT